MEEDYTRQERREFIRLDYVTPLAYKVCKEETISKLLLGYISNISEIGILCNIDYNVNQGDILWLSFDRATLTICEKLEKNILIYQNGLIGKVVRIDKKNDGLYDVGIKFITRQESDSINSYPKINFLLKGSRLQNE
ncbi:MAG: PilZ domain-containing protein [Candidatus Omnitrophota bacterium]